MRGFGDLTSIRVRGLLSTLLLVAGIMCAQARESMSIAGTWQLRLDREDTGEADGWWRETWVGDPIELPGTLQEQRYGNEITSGTAWMGRLYDRNWHLREEFQPYTKAGNVKVPFWLNPERQYSGVAWYRREIEVPEGWAGRQLELFFEKVQWSTTVWIDGERAGYDDSLSAPHRYELAGLEPGKHTLTVRIDNRKLLTIREDAHSITDSTQTNWNGMIGKLELRAYSPVWMRDVRVYTNTTTRGAEVRVTLGNTTAAAGEGQLLLNGEAHAVQWDAGGGEASATVTFGADAALWDEFDPVLHPLVVELKGEQADDRVEMKVGLREIKSVDGEFQLNGRTIFLRGTHEGCQFPLTGYPPTDVESWRKIFEVCRAYGLNHMRFHSWCPPEAAFTAADEAGIYLQPEASNWGQYGRGAAELTEWLHRETEKMVRAYGNHASFAMIASGNEPAGRWQGPLLEWVKEWKERDPRRVYASQTGRYFEDVPGHEEIIDYLIAIYIGRLRFRGDSGWHGKDFRAGLEEASYPVVSHETGQWCAYPNFAQMDRYTGSLKPKNYEIFRDSLAAHGMLEQAHDFMMASGAFQIACYKEEIEGLLRTPGMDGFQLLDLHDYPGQGTAIVGPLNVFWESKGYITPEEWKKFCDVTVPLARLYKRIYTEGETLEVPIEIAHFGSKPIEGAQAEWWITNAAGETMTAGELELRTVELATAQPLGEVSVALADFAAPAKYELHVGLKGRADVENDWEFWVYPESVDTAAAGDVLMTRSFGEAWAKLAEGGDVLLMPRFDQLAWDSPPVGRLPIFWNRLMGPRWERFLGLVCDPGHPALAKFATDRHYDWQWQDVLIPYCRGINMDGLPGELQPIVQLIDDWNRNDKLGLVFEARVGEGRLLMCAANLETDLEERPAARQLLSSLQAYVASDEFAPEIAVTEEQLMSLRQDNGLMMRLVEAAVADASIEGNEAEKAIDGDPNTYWFTTRHRDRVDYPHELTLRFNRQVAMRGVILMNRQNERAHTGDIREYELQVSDDGDAWETVLAGELPSKFDPQEFLFDKAVTARHLRLRGLSGYGADHTAGLAEIAIVPGGRVGDTEVDGGTHGYRSIGTSTEEMDEDP